ncbi:ribosomal protein L25/Gln-tRNA synthetase, partial [Schizophyllum fasciatum]
GDVKKTKLKTTWLAAEPAQDSAAALAAPPGIDSALAPVPITLLDYDYLITKKKLEEGDEVQDYLTPQTEFRVAAVADGNVRVLKKGDVIQFERKGYFILDGDAPDGRREFIRIPDGRAAGIASKAGDASGDANDKAAGGAKGKKGGDSGKKGGDAGKKGGDSSKKGDKKDKGGNNDKDSKGGAHPPHSTPRPQADGKAVAAGQAAAYNAANAGASTNNNADPAAAAATLSPMYAVNKIYGDELPIDPAEASKMYRVEPVY